MSEREEAAARFRLRLVEAMAWLGAIDAEPPEDRLATFDEATFSLEIVMFEGGARRLLGTTLRNEAEVRALEGVRCALLCLYQALDDHGPLTVEFVSHPYLLAVACAANWASAVLDGRTGAAN